MLAELASMSESRNISEEDCPLSGGEVCLFGSGPRAVSTRDWLRGRGVGVAAYLDNDVWRQDELLDGVPILAPNKIAELGGKPVVVCCAGEHKIAIGQQLAMLGVRDAYFLEDPAQDRRPPKELLWDRLEAFCADLADEESRLSLAGVVRAVQSGRGGYARMSPYLQYKHPVVKARPGDVVFYAGGFDGMTAMALTRATGFACTVHCFEPQGDLFGRMVENSRRIPPTSFVPVNKGLYGENTTLRFNDDGYDNGFARVAEDGAVFIEVVGVDDYARERGLERVT